MLLLGSRLIGTPIMGLQTGTQLAVAKTPVIDPNNLRIIAYEVDGTLLTEKPSFIRIADIRELSDVGMIIDSNDEFVGLHDVIAIENIYKIGFRLLGLNVIDESKNKLGKVSDYSLEVGSFIIEQLSVSRGIIKSLSETERLIHRTQIVEINNENVIVKSIAEKLEPIADAKKLSYMNPFRQPAPQPDNSNADTPNVN
ncbi:MAG: hypothetical protein NTV39_00980 [Candidatus Saccharibacteria bacterium]|nr:hypothetical protein [Candidatus Saccharibacteria bacterium]